MYNVVVDSITILRYASTPRPQNTTPLDSSSLSLHNHRILIRMIAIPIRVRLHMPSKVHLPPEKPPTARKHRVVSDVREVVPQRSARVDATPAVPAGEGGEHVVGEPVPAADNVWLCEVLSGCAAMRMGCGGAYRRLPSILEAVAGAVSVL